MVHPVRGAKRDDKQRGHHPPDADRATEQARVEVRARLDDLFEEMKEASLLGLLAQQQRRQRRRERHRVEHRQRDGKGDGQRELLVEAARRAWEERHRHEHRDQHQARGDDGAKHFAHRLGGRLSRRPPILMDVPLDVLDHHDRIVDDDARRQHDAEQREGVDRKTEQLDEGEGAHQRHGNRDRRDDRAAPVLQEQEHHQHDQANGLEQRDDDFADRVLDHGRGVERHLVFHAGRKILLEPRELGQHLFVHVEGVGRGQLSDGKTHGLDAVEPQLAAVGLRADFGAAHLAQPDQRAVGCRP